VTPTRQLFFFNDDVETGLLAINNRVLGCAIGGVQVAPLVPDRDAWKINDFGKHLMRRMSSVFAMSPRDVPLGFNGPKRLAYEQAAEKYLSDGFRLKAMLLKNMVKNEVVQMKASGLPDPRAIRYRSDLRANIVAGMVMIPATKPLKSAIDKWFCQQYGNPSRFVVTAADRETQAAWLYEGFNSVPNAVVMRFDGVRYDRHFGQGPISFTQSIYKCVKQPDPADRAAFSLFCASRCRDERNLMVCRDGRIRYDSPPQRCSGDMDTWLGNEIGSAKMVDEIARRLAQEGLPRGHGYYCATSDDMAIVVPRCYVERAKELAEHVFRRHGFRTEVEVVSSDYRRFFWMQSFLYYDDSSRTRHGPRLIRLVRRAMTRDLISAKNFSDQSYYEGWLTSVGIAGLICFGDVPILGAMYAAILRGGNGRAPVTDHDKYWWGYEALAGLELGRLIPNPGSRNGMFIRKEKMDEFFANRAEPTTALRQAVYEVEGLSHHEQLGFEAYFDGLQLVWSPPEDAVDPIGERLFD